MVNKERVADWLSTALRSWRCAVAVAFGILACPMSCAVSLDSIVNLPAMGIPVINYTPETSWEFGAAAQGYFCLPGQQRTSIVQLDGAYTLKHQWYVNTLGTIYFGGHTPWQLQYRAGYNHRPTAFYGIGNQGTTDIGMLRSGQVDNAVQRHCAGHRTSQYPKRYSNSTTPTAQCR